MSVESKTAVGSNGEGGMAGPERMWVEGPEGRSRRQPSGRPRIEILEAAPKIGCRTSSLEDEPCKEPNKGLKPRYRMVYLHEY